MIRALHRSSEHGGPIGFGGKNASAGNSIICPIVIAGATGSAADQQDEQDKRSESRQHPRLLIREFQLYRQESC
jgi:hypothetical protein